MSILSILIPSCNEEWLGRTIEDILSNIEGDTEIIVALDGYTIPISPLPEDSRLVIIRHSQALGQRAATNEAARLSRSKYVMKIDAHCAFDKGFDVKMIEAFKVTGDNVTMAPLMRNLHVFDWVCPDGHRRYQGLSGPCTECQKPTVKEVVWIAKRNPKAVSFCFDAEPHFQYFGDWTRRPGWSGPISETMSLQGSCFMCTREKYFELDLCSEEFGSWGSQGIEVACKTWLSGGRVLVNHETWYAHLFRTKGGDFGFPYHLSGSQVSKAKAHARELFFNSKWPKTIHPLSWLLEKFWPVKGWTDADLVKLKESEKGAAKGMIFYTDNQLEPKLAEAVKENLAKISQEKNIPIVSSSLKKIAFGKKNIHFPHLKRGYFAMAKQIYAAIENSEAEWIFFCEHDVMYHPSHFDFIPPTKDKFYYNRNFWKLRSDGHAVHFDADQLSGLCAHRDLLLVEYKKIMEFIEKNGFSYKTVSFEPGTRDGRSEWWKSEFPIVDVRHGTNLTPDKWSQDDFRDKSTCTGWLESDMEIPGWGKTEDLVKKLY
jgi:glycosyltransferase involved in cell wall biosynthesis